MKRMLGLLTMGLFLLCGCVPEEDVYWEQPSAQITPMLPEPAETVPDAVPVRAVWIPVMHYGDWMTGQTEEAFRTKMQAVFAECAAFGLNTVFLHVRAYADAYYDSALFPRGAYLTGSYDPLAVMTQAAHEAGLAVHAWINPLRCQTASQLAALDRQYTLRQWYDDDTRNGTRLVCVDGRYWLNPAYAEVRELVADGVAEILTQYDVEGIHIDDYFYPTQEESFDAAAFAGSDAADLGDFRRANCDALVQTLYDTVKAHDPDCIFSISPQGNLDAGYDTLYADAGKWASEPGYCDWMIPQLYYGFENGTCPFEPTLHRWETLAGHARLIVGLAPYKIGANDPWAGSGADEWQTADDVLSRETALVLAEEAVDGVAFYSFQTLFAPAADVAEAVTAERSRIGALLQTE